MQALPVDQNTPDIQGPPSQTIDYCATLRSKLTSSSSLLENLTKNATFLNSLDMVEILKSDYNTIMHIPVVFQANLGCAYNTILKNLVPLDTTQDIERSSPLFMLQTLFPRWLLRKDPKFSPSSPRLKQPNPYTDDNVLANRLWLFANGKYETLEASSC